MTDIFFVTKQSVSNKILSCSFKVKPEHPLFAVHFPKNPVIPGAFLLSFVKDKVLKLSNTHSKLMIIITRVNFKNLITPNMEVLLKINVLKIPFIQFSFFRNNLEDNLKNSILCQGEIKIIKLNKRK